MPDWASDVLKEGGAIAAMFIGFLLMVFVLKGIFRGCSWLADKFLIPYRDAGIRFLGTMEEHARTNTAAICGIKDQLDQQTKALQGVAGDTKHTAVSMQLVNDNMRQLLNGRVDKPHPSGKPRPHEQPQRDDELEPS